MSVAHVDITIRLGRTKNFLSRAIIERLIKESARAVRLKGSYAVSVSLAGALAMQKLNRTYRGKDKPTNVLAFESRDATKEAPRDLGDIFLCPSVIKKEAPNFMMTAHQHAARLVIHGLLHLVGYDHKHDRDAKLMERLEKKILQEVL